MGTIVKGLWMGAGLWVVWGLFSMEMSLVKLAGGMKKEQPGKVVVRAHCFGENSRLYKLVTAERLEYKSFSELEDVFFYAINRSDCDGCTPLHHLVRHEDATVDLVKLFIAKGASLYIKNKWLEDPYHYGVTYDNMVKDNVIKKSYFYNTKVLNFIHSEMLSAKLQKLIEGQLSGEHTKKSSTFYKIQ